jgi:hypothetical protein
MKELGPKGFTVLHVEFGPQTPLEQFAAWLRAGAHDYPCLYDADGANAARYQVAGFPYGLVLDRSGRVAWEGHPVGRGVSAAKDAIERALAR